MFPHALVHYTLHPTAYTLNPTPYSLFPTFYTPNPTLIHEADGAEISTTPAGSGGPAVWRTGQKLQLLE